MNDEVQQSFGSVLKTAREEQNISLAQVSETLKLSVEKISDIEESRIDSLPPAAFTCGYLRLFSKLVSVDENEVIKAYNNALGQVPADGVLYTTSDIPNQANSSHLGMKIVSYSFVLVIAVLIIVWLQDKQTDSVVESQSVVEVEDVQNESSDVEVINDVLDVTNNSVSISENNELSTQISTVEPIENVKHNDSDVTESESESESESVMDVDQPAEGLIEISDTLVDADEETEKNIALAKEASPIAASGEDVIALTAKDDCWIEISDSNGHLLYFSLLKKGEVAELKGQEPFKVFLGKAMAVSVTLNNINYDVSEYVRSNQIARFTMTMDRALELQMQ